MVLDGHHSFLSIILSGMPQGTMLGLSLFILFVNDLELWVKKSFVKLFADESRISKTVNDLHLHCSKQIQTVRLTGH